MNFIMLIHIEPYFPSRLYHFLLDSPQATLYNLCIALKRYSGKSKRIKILKREGMSLAESIRRKLSPNVAQKIVEEIKLRNM
jgi:hypothetical protein